MLLREGGFYLSREDKAFGPLIFDAPSGRFTVKGRPPSMGWYPDGLRSGKEMPDDLVADLLPRRTSVLERVLRNRSDE